MNIFRTTLYMLLFSAGVSAYDPSTCTHKWWFNLGVGAGISSSGYHSGNNSGPAIQLSFNGMFTEQMFLSVASTATSASSNGPDVDDFGVLLGYKSTHPDWYWSAAAGITRLTVEKNNYWDWAWEKKQSVAIPVDLQLFYTPFKHFGFGLIAHGAAGGGNRYGAIMLGLQVF